MTNQIKLLIASLKLLGFKNPSSPSFLPMIKADEVLVYIIDSNLKIEIEFSNLYSTYLMTYLNPKFNHYVNEYRVTDNSISDILEHVNKLENELFTSTSN